MKEGSALQKQTRVNERRFSTPETDESKTKKVQHSRNRPE